MSKILLVEDDPMISEIYQRKFEAAGFEVSVAATGKEVINKAAKENFDLILLDLVLPEIDGLQVLKELKQKGKYSPQTKVVIFSNLNEKEQQDKAFALGADGFIAKSQFSPSQLVEEIRRMIGEFAASEKNEEKRQNGENPDSQTNAGNGKKILLIEDENIFVEMFGKKLRDEGFAVTAIQNGNLGIKEALAGDYDLIIVDIVVPAMTGDEIIVALKKEEKTKNTPFIVLSASLEDEELKKVRELGVEDYFVKTRITPSDLVKKVKEKLKMLE